MRKTPTQRLVELRTGRDLEELLRDLYVERRYGDLEIGEALGVSRQLVQQWRERLGITREDREPIQVRPLAHADQPGEAA